MNPEDEAGFIACETFYELWEQRLDKPVKRSEFWTNRHRKSFAKIGQQCLVAKVDIRDFLKVSFMIVDQNYKALMPKDFVGPDAMVRYMMYKARYALTPGHLWERQENSLIEMATRLIPAAYENEAAILRQSHLSFTAWFRVFYATPADAIVWRIYAEAAWSELLTDAQLRQFLREKRPEGMKRIEAAFGHFSDLTEDNNADASGNIHKGFSGTAAGSSCQEC